MSRPLWPALGSSGGSTGSRARSLMAVATSHPPAPFAMVSQRPQGAPWWALLVSGLGLGTAVALLLRLLAWWRSYQKFQSRPLRALPRPDDRPADAAGGGRLQELVAQWRIHAEETRETTASLRKSVEQQQRLYQMVATDFQRKLDEASKRKLGTLRMEVAPESLQQLRSLVSCKQGGPSTSGAPSASAALAPSTGAGTPAPEAEAALQRLLRTSASEAEAKRSLQTLSMILQNLLSHPTQEKYKEVSASSARFRETFEASDGAAAELLKLAGFQQEGESFKWLNGSGRTMEASKLQEFLQEALREERYKKEDKPSPRKEDMASMEGMAPWASAMVQEPRTRRLSKFSRYSVDETDFLKKKAQSLLPDLNLVLERLRSGNEGLSESEMERYGAAFVRFKDPDGPELHKDELPSMLSFLGFPNTDPEKCREIADDCADYETFEKSDFLEFMEKWIAWERERYKEIFASYDDDGSGFLDTTELMTFVSSLGFTPLRSMVKEALDLVDMDRNGLLDFEEVVLLMHCYRHSEGFTLDELQTITAIYQDVVDQVSRRREGTNLLPAEMLGDVLVQFFGPAQAQKAREMQQECIARMNKRESNRPSSQSQHARPKTTFGMGFHEVLLWARRLREKEFENYREAFRKFDEDGSDSIDMDELQNVIKTLGYTMTKATIREIKQAAFARTDLDDMCARTSSEVLDSECMDYDSFVHFMMMLQQSDGFSSAEIQEIKDTFKKFDEDGSGDIDVCELRDMLRFQGHAASMDEVRRLHSRVDFNGSGALDMAEFIRFMRLYREEMLESVRK
ncbi:unnamed protein product, partial [Durusdinium trenchii]